MSGYVDYTGDRDVHRVRHAAGYDAHKRGDRGDVAHREYELLIFQLL